MRLDGKSVHTSEIETLLSKLAHRGRDGYGVAFGHRHSSVNTDLGLGHRRLSIIDLHDNAAQPMYYADKRLCVTYNGEIYNYLELKTFLKSKSYAFTTQSDTEVLLAAYDYWGTACVQHLNGMYAFAVWDDKQKQLFCARDPLGIKPFYYSLTDAWFAFASESQALTHLTNKDLNVDALLAYLLSMYVPSEASIFSGIKKLPPGHTLVIDHKGKMMQQRFWSISEFKGVQANADSLLQLDSVISNAVKRQLRSDVPVGGFLSGGVDSGLITALAAPHAKRFHTYSVGYEGLIDSELPYARLIAQRYDTAHTELTITSSHAMQNLNKALQTMSEPIADPAIVATYMLSELAAADGVKVLLNGTGGDEIFGGYTRYTGQLSLKRKWLLRMPSLLKHCVQYFPLTHKVKTRLKHPGLDMMFSTGGSYSLAASLLTDTSYFSTFLAKLADAFAFSHAAIPLLYQHMLFDLQVYLPDELLFLLDQMTMAHTVEGRVPLLDVEIIKASFNFSADDHVRDGQTKALLKRIAVPYLGAQHVGRKKQGFAGSPQWWVQNHREEFMSVVAEVKQIPHFQDFDVDMIRREGNANDMFILYCLCQWHDRIKRMH